MSKALFCPECFNDEKFREVEEVETHKIRGELFKNNVTKYICKVCGEDIIPDEQFDKSLLDAFNQYRDKHNMLFPEDIKNIREKYGLSQRAFARLLGMGEITIHRYETGALQEQGPDALMKLLNDPENVLKVLEDNRSNLKDREYFQIKTRAEELIYKKPIEESDVVKKLKRVDFEFTGNKQFNIEKFTNMIIFFAQNIKELWKTKTLKLLWYAEFLHFKRTASSISGTPFIHWNLGPVPKHIYGLIDIMAEDMNSIQLEELSKPFCQGEVVRPLKSYNESIFNNEAINTLNTVINQFKDYTASQLIELTHQEKAYKETIHNQLISYKYAYDIEIV